MNNFLKSNKKILTFFLILIIGRSSNPYLPDINKKLEPTSLSDEIIDSVFAYAVLWFSRQSIILIFTKSPIDAFTKFSLIVIGFDWYG